MCGGRSEQLADKHFQRDGCVAAMPSGGIGGSRSEARYRFLDREKADWLKKCPSECGGVTVMETDLSPLCVSSVSHVSAGRICSALIIYTLN